MYGHRPSSEMYGHRPILSPILTAKVSTQKYENHIVSCQHKSCNQTTVYHKAKCVSWKSLSHTHQLIWSLSYSNRLWYPFWQMSIGWWRGSVVMSSVFDWRTFPDMRLIYGWRVTTSWVRRPLCMGQPTRPTQPPTLSGTGNEYIVYRSIDGWNC